MLVEYFVSATRKSGKQICKIDNKTLGLCQSYAWREHPRLQNIVEDQSCAAAFLIEGWLASVQPPGRSSRSFADTSRIGRNY
jgi:hypothetical protein